MLDYISDLAYNSRCYSVIFKRNFAMQCIRCKKEIKDNVLRCTYCNTKVQTVCPVCKSLNPIKSKFCGQCGLSLIKYCPVCHCANLPSAKECRKCKQVFTFKEVKKATPPIIEKRPATIQKAESPMLSIAQELHSDQTRIPAAQNAYRNRNQGQPQGQPQMQPQAQAPSLINQVQEQAHYSYVSPNMYNAPVIEESESISVSLSDSDSGESLVELEPIKEFDTGVQTEPQNLNIEIYSDESPVIEIESARVETASNIEFGTDTLTTESYEENTVSLFTMAEEEPVLDMRSDLINTSEETAPEYDFSARIRDEKIVPAMEIQISESYYEEETEEQYSGDLSIADEIDTMEESSDLESISIDETGETGETGGAKASSELEEDSETDDYELTEPPLTSSPDELQGTQGVEDEYGVEIFSSKEDINETNQTLCKNTIASAVRSTDKLVIGLSGEEGFGKSTVLKYLFSDLMHLNYNWLWGECSANTQISPFGVFQEMLLTFFNCPNYTNMSNEFKNNIQAGFKNFFPGFTQPEICDLFNFLYPTVSANFEKILINKNVTFALLEKLLLEIAKKGRLVITIDDFDMIDGASYEFLVNFIDKGNLSSNIKLVIAYKDKRIAQGYFLTDKVAENQYQDVYLGQLDRVNADKLVKLFINGVNPLPDEVFEQIYDYSKGNSAYIEQVLVLMNEHEAFVEESATVKYKRNSVELKIPTNIHDVVNKRIEILQKKFPVVLRTLYAASILGNKFNINMLENVMKVSTDDFQNIIKLLATSSYISKFNNSQYVFKNTLLWKMVYEKAKQSEAFEILNEKIFDVISGKVLSNNSVRALVAQNLNQKLLALTAWTENTKLCAYLGDEHLWTLSQKQSLRIAQDLNPEGNKITINNIYERMGKLMYTSKPVEAVEYLSYAISQAMKISNIPKVIELSGYLSKSCSITGNYHGVIEAIDTILKLTNKPEFRLENALLKYKKLKALFSIGNSEEIFNIASNEIIPIIEQAISNIIPLKNTPLEVVYETWLETNLIVANALSIQGNNKCFHILSLIDEIIVKNNIENKNYLNRVSLAKALAHSVQGNIKKSEDILIDVNQKTAVDIVEPEIISQWNFINILNKIYKREWSNLKEDMYSVVTFANNYNDVLVKNILKIFLGKILQEEGNLQRAMDIYNEQVTIFAKEKIAIGALLCWYYIARITLVTEGSDKALEIAQKALEVAKNPKINNYYFMVIYKKLIAEIYMIKGDLEATKMYIEKALMIVKAYDLKLQKVLLYQLYTKYLEEMVSSKPQNKNIYAQNAINTYKKSLTMLKNMNLPQIESEIQKELSAFKAFCQMNEIKY